MNDELKKAVRKSQVSLQKPFTQERHAFKALLLSNPNYFGTLEKSAFTPVVPIAGNTFYEELGCVGYHPQRELLEGVVYVYQPSGYGTDVCGAGTPEYVRFYLSFDHGATWVDQGMTSFQAYNVPEGTQGARRLEYAVTLKVDPARKRCTADHLIRVRAILSWNDPPPPNQPNWAPVWGNVREAAIQVEPRRFVLPTDIFEGLKVKPEIASLLGNAPIAVQPVSPGVAELAAAYKHAGVPPHRFAFKELHAFAAGQLPLSAEAFGKALPGVAFEPGIGDLLFPTTDGDTSYEELRCIGLDPNTPDGLVGIIQVKKSAGYSGGPCTEGSREHVTFWADTDGNGTFDTCLGTAHVTVYDLPVPAGGVWYAVRLPVDLSAYRRPCEDGPRVMRIRAILSWSVAPPCANPNYVPAWGNREETLIHVAPKAQVPGGKIAILGGIPVGHIDDVTGLTTATAVFATNNLPPDALGRPCPFGLRVSVQGLPIPGWSYTVEVSPDGAVWTPVLTDLSVVDGLGNTSTHKADNATKRFDYLPFASNVNNLLAEWDTAGDALWFVRLTVFDPGGVPQGSDVHRLQLDNTGPDVAIVITSGAGSCGKFVSGSVLAGTVTATDTYLGSYSLAVEPNVNDPGEAVPVPSGGTVNTAAGGDAWTLDTTGMQACGYVIRVVAVDRAILNSQSVGHVRTDSDGFCLEVEAAPEA
ncbi:MAG: hypothetical protein AB7O28_04825 [Vicinamibacterales bacterium]